MPAPPLANSFEGGTDGVTISNANSGGSSGDAFSAVVGSPTFSTDHAVRGSLGMKIDVNGAGTNENVSWTALGTITTAVFFRAYIYFDAHPATNYRIFTFKTNANTVNFWFTLTASGQLRVFNSTSTQLLAGTFVMTTGKWWRIEGRVVSDSTGAGEIDAYIFDGHSTSQEEFLSGNTFVIGNDADRVFWGPEAGTPPTTFTAYYDDVAVSTSGLIGPSGAAAIPIPAGHFDPQLRAEAWF